MLQGISITHPSAKNASVFERESPFHTNSFVRFITRPSSAEREIEFAVCRSRLRTHPLRETGEVPMPTGRGCEPRADGDALVGREVRSAIGADPEVRLHDAAVSVAAGRQ